MVKKILSGLIAATMVISSMAMVVSADDTQYETGKFYVGETAYDTFSTALANTPVDGTLIVSGTVEFESRQGIAKNITLQGVNNAIVVPKSTFGNSTSETNKKGLLNISADVTVNDITFDGSLFGDTIDMSLIGGSSFKDFVVLRFNGGTSTLNNVTVSGSPKAVVQIGMESTPAYVTFKNVICNGEVDKAVDDSYTYADVDVVNGTLTLKDNTEINAFMQENGGTYSDETNSVFELRYNKSLLPFVKQWVYISSTVKHFAETFVDGNISDSTKSKYVTSITDSENLSAVEGMVAYAMANISTDNVTATKLLTVLDYAVEKTENSSITTLRNQLQSALNGGE